MLELFDQDVELKFTYLKKRNKSDIRVDYRTPGVMDGGYIIHGNIGSDGLYHVQLYEDGFAFETYLYEIKFNSKLEKGKEYTIYKRRGINKLYATCPFTIVYDRAAEEEKHRQEEEQKIKDGKFDDFTPHHMLRLIRLSNPQTMRDKVFKNISEESKEGMGVVHYSGIGLPGWSKFLEDKKNETQ